VTPARTAAFVTCRVDAAAARAVVDPAVARRLCDGHFPGNPIVPGSAITGLMVDLARRLAGADRAWTVEQAGFVAPLRAAPAIELDATAVGDDAVRVTVRQGGRRAARGVVRFARP